MSNFSQDHLPIIPSFQSSCQPIGKAGSSPLPLVVHWASVKMTAIVFWLCYHLVAEGVAGACTYCLMTDNSSTLLASQTEFGSGLGLAAGLNTNGPGGI